VVGQQDTNVGALCDGHVTLKVLPPLILGRFIEDQEKIQSACLILHLGTLITFLREPKQ